MQLLYIPLDERPCNFYYPQLIAQLQPDLNLRVPPCALLGQKKKAAQLEALWDWLETEITGCSIAILSIDMLVYGGLLPSRIHQDRPQHLLGNLKRLTALKQAHPHLELFASTLIMRTPAYNSSEEEPDYYGDHGLQIFQWGWLQDKQQRMGLDETEQNQLAELEIHLPTRYLKDYQQRRRTNLAINQAAINLVAQGTLSFLVIPQDDSARYGFTALDQQQIVEQIRSQRLQNRIHLYPGADEVGCTLLARAYQQLRGSCATFALLYSATAGDQVVPLYEDRPLGESVKAHLLAAGARLAANQQTADCVLALNSPGQVMQEAWDQTTQNISYTRDRNLRFFVDQIQQCLQHNRPVALADVAFANGGETELIQMLDDANLWDHLLAYGGWNTSCNTIGTVLATAIIGLDHGNPSAITANLIHHVLEDWAYQSVVRMEMVTDYLPMLGVSYYDFKGQDNRIHQEMADRIQRLWFQTMQKSFRQAMIHSLRVTAPWQRMFEIDLRFDLATVSPITPPPTGPS